jgi:hypothetical protein
MIGVVCVLWSATLITVVKHVDCGMVPASVSGMIMHKVLANLPEGSEIDMIIESEDVHEAWGECVYIKEHNLDPSTQIRDEHWFSAYCAWIQRGYSGMFREFDEEGQNSECIEMRMQALWSAEEMTRAGIYFWEHPEEFLGA